MTPDAGGLASDTGGPARRSMAWPEIPVARRPNGPPWTKPSRGLWRSCADSPTDPASLPPGVIGFQIGLLEDEEFLEPVRAGIEAGMAAGQAWTRHLAGEIADYESAPTGYLRERAADLRDLRDGSWRRSEEDVLRWPARTRPSGDVCPVTTRPVTVCPVTTRPVTVCPVTTRPVTVCPVTTSPSMAHPATACPITHRPVPARQATTCPTTAW